FRYLSLDEDLSITDRVQFATVPVFLSGASVTTHDFFGTENSFYGGQIGLDAQIQCGRIYAGVWGKVALGDVHQRVLIDGSTVIVAPPAPVGNVTSVGGILAQPTNIGAFNHDRFAVVSEAGAMIGVRLTDSIRVGVGYSFLYLNRVVRPGNQIDATVN